jgi:hypothetical protein
MGTTKNCWWTSWAPPLRATNGSGDWAFRWAGLFLVWILCGLTLEGASTRIMKVLPHRLDEEGRHTLSPSLYERDAYQAQLRKQPERVTGMRFDVQWKVRRTDAFDLRMRIEIRGSEDPSVHTLEERVQRRPWFNRWSSITLNQEGLRAVGEVVAWRVTLWRGSQLMAEHRSFLW